MSDREPSLDLRALPGPVRRALVRLRYEAQTLAVRGEREQLVNDLDLLDRYVLENPPRVSLPSGTPPEPRTPYGDPLPPLTPAEREDPEVQAAASRHDDLHPCGSYGGDLIVAKAMLEAARGARASRSEPPPQEPAWRLIHPMVTSDEGELYEGSRWDIVPRVGATVKGLAFTFPFDCEDAARATLDFMNAHGIGIVERPPTLESLAARREQGEGEPR